METINDLLKALDNKVPASIAKRLDGLNKLNEKLATAREEHNENPTEVSQEKLEEIVDFISDTQDDLREDLSELVAKKREADAKARQLERNRAEAEIKKEAEAKARQLARNKAEAEARQLARNKAEAEKRRLEQQKSAENSENKTETVETKQEEELKQKESIENEVLEAEPMTEPKKKSGIGWGGLVVGGALLILSAGAINYFGKRR
jgi:cobalamin biosynthesis Mg chelatase CobN